MSGCYSDPPAGPRIVWSGKHPPDEGVPKRLPGIIVEDLGEPGFALVAWVDKVGWQCPDAVYETKWLQPLSTDELEKLVKELRDSDWAGLPPSAPFKEPEVPSHLDLGTRVRWAGPLEGDRVWENAKFRQWADQALGGVLVPSHPGTVLGYESDGEPRVRWVDRLSYFDGIASVHHTYLAAIEEDEYQRRKDTLLQSVWAGLSSSKIHRD